MKDLSGKVAVVTGGAGGIGKALVGALLAEGARVVVGDVEQTVLDETIADFSSQGSDVVGVVTDVSDPASVTALADRVFETHGACHLLFNNAGVAAPSANIWETTVNDWLWVHGVNIMGVIHGIQAFVPRMIASGEAGHVVNTSSGDGGISPLPFQSVYASSKAAVSTITECLDAQLQTEKTNLRASIFYPSGGLLETGIWTTARNRPVALARESEPATPAPTIDQFKDAAKAAGMELQFQDLDDLARHCLEGIRQQQFIIMFGHEETAATLKDRASRIGRGELPIDLASLPVM
ncbi:MAG TPA: SDR family NAD(P)-dependent oxidoreductase [Myxococcales bacterium]|nr:SDR family NAD(P)-dependent oxidoreductase [Myxococcales bacterium]